MNNPRRKELEAIRNQIEELKESLSEILEQEEEYRDNIPENLQGSERYEKSDNACDNLSSAVDQLDEVMNCIEEAGE